MPGPEMKLVITRSSHDSVNASNQPEIIAGQDDRQRDDEEYLRRPRTQIHGRLFQRLVEASRGAIARSTVTYAIENVMCAMVMVVTPRPCRPAESCSMATNSSSSDRPGDHLRHHQWRSGHAGQQGDAPGIAEARQHRSPATVPRITAPVALMTRNLDAQSTPHRASAHCGTAPRTTWVGNCRAHTVTSFEALKENTTIDRIGMYRNANPNASAGQDTKNELRCFIGAPPTLPGLQILEHT